jgi:hypothetical protein
LLGLAIYVWTIQAQVVQIYFAISATAASSVSSGPRAQRKSGNLAELPNDIVLPPKPARR